MDQTLIDMGVTLTELVVKGTASTISRKIQAARSIKDAEKLRTTYDSLMNEVLQEREEAVRIAQAYKSELDRMEISDEDIQHLHTTITRILDIIKKMAPNTPIESLEAIKDLISVDTLKTMQLLGFNYKAAIGEPLTEVCSTAIKNWGSSSKKNNQNNSKRHN